MEVIRNRKLSPEIRFPYFNYEWKNSKLGAICEMKAGKFIKASEITQKYSSILYPCYGGNGLRGFTKIYNHEGKYSLIGRQGALCGNVKLVDGKFHATEHALVVYLEQELNADWVYYLLCTLNLNQYSTGQAQPGLSVSNLNAIKVKLPINIDEQQKIASFLSKVDEKITLLTKKKELLEEYKKGVTQKIFKQEIRFKDENGNDFPKWEKRKLSQLLIESNKKSTISNQYEVLSSTAKGLFSQSEYFSRDIASTNNAGYKILKKNQLVFSPQNLWMGNINVNDKFEIGIVSPSYKIFDFNEKLTSSSYCNYFLVTPRMKFEYAQSSEQGASIVRRNLDMVSFKAINFKLPLVSEQDKIANFLSLLDKKINAIEEQLSLAKEWKKGLLQKMFV